MIYILILVQALFATEVIKSKNEDRVTITFGSCNKFYQSHQTPIFEDIAQVNPDVFIWLGDVSYNDEMHFPGIWTPCTDREEMRKRFNNTKHDIYYQKLLQKVTKVMGIYDDHDFGYNNSGEEFPLKDHSKQILLEFLDDDDAERKNRKDGAYQSYYIGKENQVKIILLDGRYNKNDQDMLGVTQEKWLFEQLDDKNAEVILIGSGSQFLPDDRVNELFPLEQRNRIMEKIRWVQPYVVFLTGDIHIGEILQYPCNDKIGYQLIELTSSGLSFQLDDVSLFGIKSSYQLWFNDSYNQKKESFIGKNYGYVDIDLKKKQINMEIRTSGNLAILKRTVNYEQEKQLRDEKKNNLPQDPECYTNKYTAFQRQFTFPFQEVLFRLFIKCDLYLWGTIYWIVVYSLFVFGMYFYFLKTLYLTFTRDITRDNKEKKD